MQPLQPCTKLNEYFDLSIHVHLYTFELLSLLLLLLLLATAVHVCLHYYSLTAAFY
jgi:hypothetical protein